MWLWWALAVLLTALGLALAAFVTLARRGVGHALTLVVPHPDDVAVPWTVTVRVKFFHPLPRWLERVFGHTQLITLLRTVFANDGDIGPRAMAHEVAHVWQWVKYGVAGMGAYYLRPYVFRFTKYRDHWAEQEAFIFEDQAHKAFPAVALRDGQMQVWYPFPAERLRWQEAADWTRATASSSVRLIHM